jgi:phosphohistidine phosphatase
LLGQLCARGQDLVGRGARFARNAPILTVKPALYHAGAGYDAGGFAKCRRAMCVMMIGHNPGIAEFAHRLVSKTPISPEFRKYPTGATLVCDFAIETWDDVGFGQGVTVDFVVPREIEG